MIQRVQSLFLFGVIILQVLMFIFPLWKTELSLVPVDNNPQNAASQMQNEDVGYMSGIYFYSGDKIKEEKSTGMNMTMIALNALIAISALLSVFMFRNRKRQVMIAGALIIPLVALPVLAWLSQTIGLQDANVRSQAFSPAFYFPVASVVLLVLAIRSIRADERLVRSADRLR